MIIYIPVFPETADIAILFHATSGVRKNVFQKNLLKFMKRLSKKGYINNGNVRISVSTFGKASKLIVNPLKYKTRKKLARAIRKIKLKHRYKKADLANGLRFLRKNIFVPPYDRPEVDNFAIIITDSQSYGPNSVIEHEANMLKALGVKIYMLGIGHIDRDELKIVSSNPSQIYSQHINKYSKLSKFRKVGKPIIDVIPGCKYKIKQFIKK